MSRYKQVRVDSTIADAVSNAFSSLEELASECREVVDNASEGLSQTQRIQTLDETANQLESLSEPSVPEAIAPVVIGYVELTKSRGLSRSSRRDNAIAALAGVVDACDQIAEEAAKKDAGEEEEEAIALRDECQAAIDEAEGCEFPGMYG